MKIGWCKICWWSFSCRNCSARRPCWNRQRRRRRRRLQSPRRRPSSKVGVQWHSCRPCHLFYQRNCWQQIQLEGIRVIIFFATRRFLHLPFLWSRRQFVQLCAGKVQPVGSGLQQPNTLDGSGSYRAGGAEYARDPVQDHRGRKGVLRQGWVGELFLEFLILRLMRGW